MEEEKTSNVIEIKPVSKWKRFLVFLADFFIYFIGVFILFSLAAFPLTRVIFDTDGKSKKATALENSAITILVDKGYLFSYQDGSSFLEDVNYSFKRFLSYYAFDEETSDINHDYGHRLENETIRTYYQTAIKDLNQYVIDFKEINKEDGMFNIGETVDDISLKSDYKTMLANELLEKTNEADYSVAMTNFRDHIYARLFYLHVYTHITENDCYSADYSFNQYMADAKNIRRSLQWIATGSVLVTTIIGWGVVFVLFPLANKEKKTIAMKAIRVTKLHYKSFSSLNNKNVMVMSFYHFVICLSGSLFMPIAFFSIEYLFNLPLLFIFTSISLALIITSGVVMLINQYGRTGSDILTNAVIIDDSEIDRLYRERLDDGK